MDRVRRYLVAGGIASLLLVVGIAVTAVGALHVDATSEGELAHALADDLTDVQHLRLDAERVVAATRRVQLEPGEVARERLDTARRELEQQLAALHSLSPLAGDERVRTAVEVAVRAYTAADTRAADADTLEASVATLADRYRARFDTEVARAHTVTRDAELVLVGAAIAVVGFGTLLVIAVARRLTTLFVRMHRAQAAAEAEAAGRREILAVVSHDLRNPLHAIVLGASLLEESAPDARKQVRVLVNAATRMQHLVEDLLSAARLDAGTIHLVPERCAIDELFADTVELFTPRAEAAGVRLVAAPTRASVHGDRERLLEVLANLVGNALQHTPRGGRIELSARAVASSIRFEVADTGPGLTAEDAAHVFERHWQARRGGGGLGLGLYICRRLVEAHHGSIGVDSEPGRGATFWFEVPADVVT